MKRFVMLLMVLCLLFAQTAMAEKMRYLPEDAVQMMGSWEVKWVRANLGEKKPASGFFYDGMNVEVREDQTITFYTDEGEKTYDWAYDIGYYTFKAEDGKRYNFDLYEYVDLVIYETGGDFDREITGIILERPKAESALAQVDLPVAPAEDFEYWEDEDGGICVTKYYGSLTELAIPAEIDGLPVTKVGDHAFYMNTSLLRIEIPESVRSIGRMAFEGCTTLYDVIIHEGVEEIGRSAFRDCEALSSVKLPGSLKRLDGEAFAYCRNMTEVSMPEGLVSIGERAFTSCEGLESIVLPSTVETIGEYAFSDCSALKEMTISKNLTELGFGAFHSCSELAQIETPEGCAFAFADGALINWDEKTLTVYLQGVRADHFSVPGGVERIARGAFASCHLDSIELPEGIVEIGDEAFGNSHIKEITFPASLERMGNAFGYYNRLMSIAVAEGSAHFEVVDGLLYNKLEKELVLAAQAQLTGPVTIKEGTEAIGANVFMNSSITGVSLPESLRHIGESAFYRTPLEALTLPEGVETIAATAFGECKQMTELTLPDSIVSIGERTFAFCDALTSVKLSSGLTEIPESAFNGCKALSSIDIPEGVVSIGYRAFGDSGLQRVTLPASMQDIHKEAFYRCDSLVATVQPYSYAAQFCDEYGLQKEGEAAAYTFAYEEIDGGLRITGLVGETKKLAIPREIDGKPVLEIAKDAFRGNAQITEAAVGSAVTKIGAYAFAECSALQKFEMRGGIRALSEGMLKDCVSLESVRLYAVQSVGAHAFAGCVKLSRVQSLELVNSLGISAFAGCESLAALELPDDVTISEGAFDGCTNLAVSTRAGGQTARFCYENSIALDLEETPARYFRYTELEDGTIRIDGPAEREWQLVIPRYINGKPVTQIADKAFDNALISSLHLPEGLVSIGEQAFRDLVDLQIVNIPASVRSIGDLAFANCGSLTTVVLHEGLESIGDMAFAGCDVLSEPAIPQSVTQLGINVFMKEE